MDISQPKPTRRSPLSFLRSVKALFLSSQPAADSFVPALPHLDTSVPSTKSFFSRIFRNRSDPPCSDTQQSFFVDSDVLDQRVLSPSRLIDSGTVAYSTSRLSSAFAHTSPDLSSFSSVVPTSCSIPEQPDTLRSDSRTDLVPVS